MGDTHTHIHIHFYLTDFLFFLSTKEKSVEKMKTHNVHIL